MRTLQNLYEYMRVERTSLDCCVMFSVTVLFNRKQYHFLSKNWMAYNRIQKQDIVTDRVTLYGYSLKGAYEAFYNEFKKKRAAGTIDVL